MSTHSILIGSFEVPGYGGASTAAYSLFRMLQADGMNVHFVNLIEAPRLTFFEQQLGSAPGNPLKLENVHTIVLNNNLWGQHAVVTLGFGMIATHILGQAHEDINLIFYTSGFAQLAGYLEQGKMTTLVSLLGDLEKNVKPPRVVDNKEAYCMNRADLIITHAPHIHRLVQQFFPESTAKLHPEVIWYRDWIIDPVQHSGAQPQPFNQRQIDILFVASDWSRAVKNYPLVKEIAQTLKEFTIHVVGVCATEIPGVTHHALIKDPRQLFELMGQSRTLVCPSWYDAAPGVIFEAAKMGCNIVTTKNCGNWRLCHPKLLAGNLDRESFVQSIERSVLNYYPVDDPESESLPSYRRFEQLLSRHTNNRRLFKAVGGRQNEGAMAYCLWHYPILSETFIQREVAALARCGIPVHLLSDAPDESAVQCEAWATELKNLHYLGNAQKEGLNRASLREVLSRPFRVFRYYLGIRLDKYHVSSSPSFDRETLAKVLQMSACFKSNNIVHAHAPWGDRHAYIAAMAAKYCGITFSVQLRAHDLHRDGNRQYLGPVLKQAGKVITNTRFNVNFLSQTYPSLSKSKIIQIYNGLDVWRFHRMSEKNPVGSTLRLLAIGRITPQKGYPDLLRCCSELKARGLDFQLHIVGAPELPRCAGYFEQLQQLSEQLGINDQVSFVGSQTPAQVNQWYEQADIFVLPCVVDSDGSRDVIPNVILEAMAMEIPVISTKLSAIPEMVEDGESGHLVEPGDYKALADRIEALAHNPERRVQMGRAGRNIIEARFDIEKNIDRYANVFQNMVTGSK